MSSIASDTCDYDMGDYGCDDEGYECNAHLSGYGNQGQVWKECVKGLGTKIIDFPIFKGWRDPETYVDREWQCTSVINGGRQVPAKEPTIKGVMDALTGCSNIQGKEDLSCGHQGTIAKLNTFAIKNEQSVNVTLSLSEPIDSLPHIDNVFVESVDTLVDPIDDRIDSSSKIDLCPPSVDIYALNASSLFCNDCVDQPICECSSLVEGSCNVIKEPLFGGTNCNVPYFAFTSFM
uniref:Uncharacterized protein n=1 Tax=Solanum tuberosum TaxID=4113 RepID=M1DY19_SOLTU